MTRFENASLSLFADEVQGGAPVPVLKSRNLHDPVGMWYAARARSGIDDRMWFGLYEGGARAPRWHTCSHRYADGLGALPLLLTERGYRAAPPPRARPEGMPHWRKLWRLWRDAAPAPRLDMRWHFADASLAKCPGHAPVSLLLSAAQTAEVDRAAAVAGVSPTVWLQWTADRALRLTLAGQDSVAGWVFPVNLRGNVHAPDAHANQCSGLTLRLGADATPATVRQQISAGFVQQEHWRTWLLLNIGRWVGQAGINLLYRLSQARPGTFAGSYSNLGEWNVAGLDGVIGIAPGSPAYPVSVGTVLCNGRRSLGCRLHPVVGGNAGRAIEYLLHWRELSMRVGAEAAAAATPPRRAVPA
ncbi:MAG: hypothetical protein QM762_02045 [Chryseolinea sp.]